jgi:hypothetical protein
MYGTAGHLEASGEFTSSETPVSLQEQESAEEAVRFHKTIIQR